MEEHLKQLANQAVSEIEFSCIGAENYVKVAGSWDNWRPRNLIYNELDDTWQLTLNLGGENRRVKNIELYVLLLEDCVMFLQVSYRHLSS